MIKREKEQPSQRVLVGGKRIPLAVAALMGQEADRRRVPPSIVGRVDLPDPPPTHVEIAGNRLTLRTAALLTSAADGQGVELARVIEDILEESAPQMASEDKARKPPRG